MIWCNFGQAIFCIIIIHYLLLNIMLQRVKQQIKKRAAIEINYANGKEIVSLISSEDTRNIIRLQLQNNNIDHLLIRQLLQGKWKNLCKIDLLRNKVGNKGCQYLTRANIKKLNEINLSQNLIGTSGVLHLSKSCWKHMDTMILGSNYITFGGSQWLSKGNWNIKSMSLHWNKLKSQDMLALLLVEWKKISYLSLGYNTMVPRRQEVRKLLQLKCQTMNIYF